MDTKITIIEGPSPTFELVNESWPFGLNESPGQMEIARTTLRTANGPSLVERCLTAWRHNQPMRLEFRSEDGLKQEAPIVAARSSSTADGDVLYLWVRFDTDKIDMAFAFDNDLDDEDDDPDNPNLPF